MDSFPPITSRSHVSLVERFRRHHTWHVCSWSLHFFGGDISIGDIVYHAHALLNKLHMHKVIIVGHSMGGDMASHFAAKYPDRTFAVIAIGAVNANKSAAGTFEKRA
jgi:pimeloyl-ACP methyl ester carboxylesterase